MRFGSVCSGIEAATVASAHLGWDAAWFSEIEKFPSAVLAHHYPNTPNHGDMMMLPLAIREGKVEAPDMLVGGTPCQAFSIAGRREGLEDARGNLTLTFCEIADAIDEVRHEQGKQPAIIFWENVPGVLSDKTNAFGCFLAELAGEEEPFVPPTKWTKSGIVVGPKRTIAWRTLDAQHFGLAQRRQRVFVVASSRTDVHPAKILLEFGGVRRDSAPSREAGKETTTDVGTGFTATISSMSDPVQTLCASDYKGAGNQYFNEGKVVAIQEMGGCPNGEEQSTHSHFVVRRLTVTECERLMGFPDNYTNIPWRGKAESPDGPRYKALGNSWAVNCVRWIFDRIDSSIK